jgi:hypothetical protein
MLSKSKAKVYKHALARWGGKLLLKELTRQEWQSYEANKSSDCSSDGTLSFSWACGSPTSYKREC